MHERLVIWLAARDVSFVLPRAAAIIWIQVDRFARWLSGDLLMLERPSVHLERLHRSRLQRRA